MRHSIRHLLVVVTLLCAHAACAAPELLPDGLLDGEAVDALGLEQVSEVCEKKRDTVTACHLPSPLGYDVAVVRNAGAGVTIKRSLCGTRPIDTDPPSLLTICVGSKGDTGFVVTLIETKAAESGLSDRFETQILRLLNPQKTLTTGLHGLPDT
jgi:hypothetical protein